MFSAATKTGSQPSQAANYIEDVFSTYLYTGTGAALSINNGIDVSTKGGLVWLKGRSAGYGNWLADTVRGPSNRLVTDSTSASASVSNTITSFNTNGFSLGSDFNVNDTGVTWASWTFRKQPKFFDVVTYTGTGANQNISHSLGSVPGMIITKRISSTANWAVFTRTSSTDCISGLSLNTTQASLYSGTFGTDVTSTTFNPNTYIFDANGNPQNTSGQTYVAYLFASNAGGFGLSGTDNVISCGSFTTDSSGNASVSLGYEPQYVLVKGSNAVNDWIIQDTMRGMSYTNSRWLYTNTSSAEISSSPILKPTATGFISENGNLNTSTTYIYMAIRRPMKVPTDATTVYAPIYVSSSPSDYDVTFTGLSYVDHIISWKDASSNGYNAPIWNDRLRGFPINMAATTWANNPGLTSALTDAEATGVYPPTTGTSAGYAANYLSGVTMNRAVWGGGWTGYTGVFHGLKRASGFFDEVCYTGTGSGTTQAHNLGVAPELLIVKRRSAAGTSWATWVTTLTADQSLALNTTASKTDVFSVGFWNSTLPTSSVFSVGSNVNTNSNGQTYVAYLFATCPGVSKVGSYTGVGSNQTINCGFTGGARFVLIKRTDDVGNWYVWNTASGMVSGTDRKLKLNSNDAQTNADWALTTTGGFQIVTTDADVNYPGGTYIYLAIA